MVGDLVMVMNHKIHDYIYAFVSEVKDDGISCIAVDMEWMNVVTSARWYDVAGVPITPDVMMANGWDVYKHKNLAAYERIDAPITIQGIWMYCRCEFLCEVEFVHQVQHMLRLLGKDEGKWDMAKLLYHD